MLEKTHRTRFPVLCSPSVLREEFFGGIVFRHTLPQQLRLDWLRFNIARLCDGTLLSPDIERLLGKSLIHSAEHISFLVQDTLNRLYKYGLLEWRDTPGRKASGNEPSLHFDFDRPPLLSAPANIIFEVTRRCNLICRHCFSDSGKPGPAELSLKQVKYLLDQFAEKKVLFVNFTGGEPLLRGDLIEILKHASTKNFAFDIATNGTLITEKFVDALQDTSMRQIQVSVDGIGSTHDQIRGFSGAFRKTLDAIELLTRGGIHVIIGTTINKANLHEIQQIIDLAVNVGATTFKTTLFIPTGRGIAALDEMALNSSDVRLAAHMIMSKEKQWGDRLHIIRDGFYPWLLEQAESPIPLWQREQNVGCAAGRENLFVTASGDVTPCPFLLNLIAGNLLRQGLDEIWHSNNFDFCRSLTPGDLQGKCGSCEHLGGSCFGGCRAAAFAYNQNLFGEDPFCWKSSSTIQYKTRG